MLVGSVVTAGAQSKQSFKSETTRKAAEKISRGDRAGALEILDKAIEKRKDLLEAYQMRASLRSMAGDLDGALADYSAALEVSPNHAEIHERRATLRKFKRDHAGALRDLEAAIANGLKSEKVYTGRASIRHDMGDVEGAIADYQTALAINPNYVSAHVGLSSTLERRGDMEGALDHLQRFIDSYEGGRGGKLPRIKGETSAGESVLIKRDGQEKDGTQAFMEGREVVSASAASSPDEYEQLLNLAVAYANLGRLYAKKNDLDRAMEYYEKGLRIRKDDAYLLNLRSEARIKKGDLQGAIEDLTVAVNSRMGGPDRHIQKGLLLLLQGKDAEAEKEFALHRQMFPGVSTVYMDRRIEEVKQLRSRQPQQ